MLPKTAAGTLMTSGEEYTYAQAMAKVWKIGNLSDLGIGVVRSKRIAIEALILKIPDREGGNKSVQLAARLVGALINSSEFRFCIRWQKEG